MFIEYDRYLAFKEIQGGYYSHCSDNHRQSLRRSLVGQQSGHLFLKKRDCTTSSGKNPVFIIYCCVTNYPQTWQLRNIISQFLYIRKLEAVQLGGSGSGPPIKLDASHWLRLQSSEGGLGLEGMAPRWSIHKAYSRRTQHPISPWYWS